MDTDIVYIKADDTCKDITEDTETKFDTSNYELDRQLPKGKIVLMEKELDRKIMTIFGELRAKTYIDLIDDTCIDLIDDGREDKNTKGVNIN